MTYGGHIQLLHLVEQAKGGGVYSDDIGGGDQGFQGSHIGRALSLRAVLVHDAISVHDVQYRFLLPSANIGDALLQIILMEETAIPYDSHIVLHGASHLRPTMVLQYGDVDPCVRLDQGLMDLGAFQVHATRNGYFLKLFLIVGRHDDTSGLFYGLGDPACLVAFLPVIAGVVEYGHFRGAGLQAFFDQGFH